MRRGSESLGQQQREAELAGKTLQVVLQRCPQQLSLEGVCHPLPIPSPWFHIAVWIIK